jgi:hypothetical protein
MASCLGIGRIWEGSIGVMTRGTVLAFACRDLGKPREPLRGQSVSRLRFELGAYEINFSRLYMRVYSMYTFLKGFEGRNIHLY